MRNASQTDAGFTLLEVMVSLLILTAGALALAQFGLLSVRNASTDVQDEQALAMESRASVMITEARRAGQNPAVSQDTIDGITYTVTAAPTQGWLPLGLDLELWNIRVSWVAGDGTKHAVLMQETVDTNPAYGFRESGATS